jgi:hypothetical protein
VRVGPTPRRSFDPTTPRARDRPPWRLLGPPIRGAVEELSLRGTRARGRRQRTEAVLPSWARCTRSGVGGTRLRLLSMRNGERPRRSSRSHESSRDQCKYGYRLAALRGIIVRRVCAGGRSCCAWPRTRRVKVPTHGCPGQLCLVQWIGDVLRDPRCWRPVGRASCCARHDRELLRDSSWCAYPMRLTGGRHDIGLQCV